jgi:phenylacetate-CoA ligase
MKLDMSTYEPFGLEAIETGSRDEIAAVQTSRLKRTLHTVYENVPAYRKKFDAAGVTPSDFRRLEDLQKFPFTTKQDLRDNYPFGMFAVPKERVARVHASSGKTAGSRRSACHPAASPNPGPFAM